jgi:5-methylcytosine-specific restriction endonuclease McrA
MRAYNKDYRKYKAQPRNTIVVDRNRVIPKPSPGYSPLKVKSWRASNDYREEYLRKNRGILGMLYICSQCFRPIVDIAKLEVDHIIPPSVLSHKKRKAGKLISNTSFLSRQLNHSFNCVAICSRCNKEKSNQLGGYLVKAIAAKVIEIGFGMAQKLAVGALFAALMIASFLFKGIGKVFCKKHKLKQKYVW